MKKIFQIFLIVSLLAPIYQVKAESSKSLNICISNSNGALKAKERCSKKESPVNKALLEELSLNIFNAQSPTGLNVYDRNGNLLGPLIGQQEMMITIDEVKYVIRFTPVAIEAVNSTVFFSTNDCTGTPYIYGGNPNDLVRYTKMGTVVVGYPNNTLYLPKLPYIQAFTYASVSTNGTTCSNVTPGTYYKAGYEAEGRGSVDQTFPAPFDVHE